MAVAKEQIRQIISENNISSVADVYSLLRDSFKDILQELLEAEMDASLGYSKNHKAGPVSYTHLVAAMGVAMKSNMLVVLLQIGLCAGIQPLIGYNYGARNKKRLMQVFRFTGICAVIMGTVLTIIMMIARRTLIQVFINDTEVIAYGIQMVIALQLSGPFIGILFLCINTIQGTVSYTHLFQAGK